MFFEMQRIVEIENVQSSMRNSWITVWSLRILSQATVERQKNKRLASVMMDFPAPAKESNAIYITAYILCISLF